MSQKLYVGGIAFTTTSEGLRAHFTQSGTVVSAAIVTDQFSGQSRGFGFVEMSTADEAQQAVTQLNERPLDGRSLKVEVAKPKTDKPRSSGGGFGGRVRETRFPVAARCFFGFARTAQREWSELREGSASGCVTA